MDTRHRLELSKNKFNRAEDKLIELKSIHYYHVLIESAYYAMYYSISALLALDGFDSSKHAAVISYFKNGYIRTKIFDKNLFELIACAYEMKTRAFYEDFYNASFEDVKIQIDNAKIFLDIIRPYLENCWAEIENKLCR